MQRITDRDLQALVRHACDLLGLPCAHPTTGGWIDRDARPDRAVAVDMGGGSVRGVCVHAILKDGGGHIGAPDPFFRVLDQRRPAREAALALRAIVEGIEAGRAYERNAQETLAGADIA